MQYKFGFQLPCNYKDAVEIDNKNGTSKWQDAINLGLKQIDEYNVFKDLRKAVKNTKGNIINAPSGR